MNSVLVHVSYKLCLYLSRRGWSRRTEGAGSVGRWPGVGCIWQNNERILTLVDVYKITWMFRRNMVFRWHRYDGHAHFSLKERRWKGFNRFMHNKYFLFPLKYIDFFLVIKRIVCIQKKIQFKFCYSRLWGNITSVRGSDLALNIQ